MVDVEDPDGAVVKYERSHQDPRIRDWQILGDPPDGPLIAEHLQRDFEPLEIIDRHQNELCLAVARDGDPLMLLAYPPTKLRRPRAP